MKAETLDVRSPLVVDTHELRRTAGAMKQISRIVEAPAHLRIELIGVPEGSPIRLEAQLESVVEGILVTLDASAALTGNCSRCLTELHREIDVHNTELYYYPEREAEEEAYRVEAGLLDLEPTLRDAIVLDLPFAPLCREDCKGLCPVCGEDLNNVSSHSHDEPIDPRWEKLTGLVIDDEVKE